MTFCIFSKGISSDFMFVFGVCTWYLCICAFCVAAFCVFFAWRSMLKMNTAITAVTATATAHGQDHPVLPSITTYPFTDWKFQQKQSNITISSIHLFSFTKNWRHFNCWHCAFLLFFWCYSLRQGAVAVAWVSHHSAGLICARTS